MITQSELKELLHYNPDTGIFTWKVKRNGSNGIKPGRIAGCLHDKGHSRRYWRIQIKGKCYYRSRLAWLYVHGLFPEQVDHINGCSTDDRIENLAGCTVGQNARNQKLHKTNKTGICGVHYEKKAGKYRARIGVNGYQEDLGLFKDFFEACCARKSAENIYGYSKNHGKPFDDSGKFSGMSK